VPSEFTALEPFHPAAITVSGQIDSLQEEQIDSLQEEVCGGGIAAPGAIPKDGQGMTGQP
jgi:hypothetical protein